VNGSIVGQALGLPNFRIGNRCSCPTTKIDIVPKLILTTQAQGKVAYEFAERSITIGRAPDNMIVIDDPSVSSRHAQMELVGETYRLKDLESTNGTKVNGVPITETLLKFEDRIRFGAIEARFEPDVRGSQPLPQLETIEVTPAESSAAPTSFGNASPFRQRSTSRDRAQLIVFGVAAIAALTFLASMIRVLFMHAP
jgi:pSer/pThr/pTyr-binding forkhead associated (FHA) protein